jgi:hypothetical protein
MATLKDVLGNANDASANLSRIEERLYKVIDFPVPTPEGWKQSESGVVYDDPKTKVVYTEDGRYLGTTGDQYESIQPRDFYDAVINNVRDCGMELDLSKLEFNVIADGRIVEFRLPTNIISFKNAVGKQDETKMFLNFWTGYGGSARTEIGLYSKRFICTNGMRIIQSDVDLKVKHTVNMNVKALTFAKEIIKVASEVERTSERWEEMNSVQVNTATVEEFTKNLAKFKKGEKYADVSTRKKNIYDQINEAVAIEFGDTGSTVWGLLNGATRYTNHMASGSDKADYVLTRAGAKTNDLAQKLALELVN